MANPAELYGVVCSASACGVSSNQAFELQQASYGEVSVSVSCVLPCKTSSEKTTDTPYSGKVFSSCARTMEFLTTP